MGVKPKSDADRYYFPDRLREALALMSRYPVTVVEAPSGFGKTTAVREYLNALPCVERQIWYTCLGESREKAWSGISALLEQIDPVLAERLRLPRPRQGERTDNASPPIGTSSGGDCFFVIDNYQLLDTRIPREVAELFFQRTGRKLHAVFITQQLDAEGRVLLNDPELHTIQAESFFFAKEDIVAYLQLSGLHIRADELDTLYRNTEGWISAIRLQIINYRETGTFSNSHGIDRLIESAIWSRIDDQQRGCLLCLSLLNGFTVRQAEVLSARHGANLIRLIESNTFIRSHPSRKSFYMHGILREYIQNRFHLLPRESREEIYQAAGDCCAATDQLPEAARFLRMAGNQDGVLSLPFSRSPLFFQKDHEFVRFILQMLAECPDEKLARYPDTLLVFSYVLLISGYPDEFGHLCGVLEESLTAPHNQGEADYLSGSLALLRSFRHAGDLEQMHAWHVRAEAGLRRRPSRLFAQFSWSYGSVSILQLLWQKSGELQSWIPLFRTYLAQYASITGGHGTGAEFAFEAEAALLRGDDKAAEALGHKAIYLAETHNQNSVCLCAELLMARIALLRGSPDDYQIALERIRRRGSQPMNRRMLELCRGFLSVTLDSDHDVCEWLKNPQSVHNALYTPAFPLGMVIYGRWLLLHRMHYALYGIAAVVLDASEQIRSLLPRVYMFLYLAQAKDREEQPDQAVEYLEKALEIALPDRVFLPFAEQDDALFTLIDGLIRDGHPHGRQLVELVRVRRRHAEGLARIKKSLGLFRPSLTKREAEVAQLAKRGLTRRQISEELAISNETVKSAMKSIYAKLGIHSRAQLYDME